MSLQNSQQPILRFSLARRLEHWLNALAFITLGVTGIAQKYIEASLSELIISTLGGIETVRIIHRVAAVVLMLVGVYHIGAFFYGWYVQLKPLSMLPDKQDLLNAWQSFRYNLGLEKEEPKQGFYTFEEKLEYWALIWGTVVMALTGFFLWNPITAASILPGSWIPAAKAAHSNEALLAVLAILIWHMYHVLIKVFNKSMYTGYMEKEIMEHEHALALEEDPWVPPSPDLPGVKRRKQTFTLVYTVFAAIFLGGIYWFVTTETTASAQPAVIPDLAQIHPFSPLDPTPFPTPIPPARVADIGTSWNDGFGELIGNRCGSCHHPVDGQANLDLTTYQGILTGGNSGPALVPNASGISLVVIWPSRGGHPGQFNPAEIAAIRAWIDNGAPEN